MESYHFESVAGDRSKDLVGEIFVKEQDAKRIYIREETVGDRVQSTHVEDWTGLNNGVIIGLGKEDLTLEVWEK